MMSRFCELPNIHSFRKAAKDSTWAWEISLHLKMDVLEKDNSCKFVEVSCSISAETWEPYSWNIRMIQNVKLSITKMRPQRQLSTTRLGPDSPNIKSKIY